MMMSEKAVEIRQFINELERRFAEVQTWAMANWPDPEHPLTSANFVEARKEILALGHAPGPGAARGADGAAEPSAGGPQYESTAPAPWP
jgi:hypothetical protein